MEDKVPRVCSECLFWDAVGSVGLCRRRAPACALRTLGVDVEIAATWPTTASADWCGEFRSLPREIGRERPKEGGARSPGECLARSFQASPATPKDRG